MLQDMSFTELSNDLNSTFYKTLCGYKLNVVNFADFIAMKLPPREDILAPWLPKQGLVMIYAPRGIGKTFVALEIAYAVTTGGSFLNWHACKPRGVLYLDGEMPAIVIQERLKAMSKSYINKPEKPFYILTPDLQTTGMPDLSTLNGQMALEPYLKEIELIIIDNISTLCRAGKENEAEAWLPIQDWALRMRAAGKSVLFIHHAGKAGKQRGTSKREDVLDAVISLTRPDDYNASDGAVFQVNFEKARNIHGEKIASFKAQLVTDLAGNHKWIRSAIELNTYEKVIKLKNDGYQQHDIADILEIHKSNVSRHIKRASEEGKIKNTNRQ